MPDSRQIDPFHRAQVFELLGVDHRAVPHQRHRAAGVAGAAAARHDGQAQRDAGLHQRRHLGLDVRAEHDEGNLHAPVGGVGHVRDARQAVETDVVASRVAGELAQRAPAQGGDFVEPGGEGGHGRARAFQQLHHQGVARAGVRILRVGAVPALVDLVQAVPQRVDQGAAALARMQQVVLQVGIALEHPDIAQHLVQHARAASGAAFLAQLGQPVPGVGAEQADDNFAVGERGVVVGNLAQARRGVRQRQGRGRRGVGSWRGNFERRNLRGVHGGHRNRHCRNWGFSWGARGCPRGDRSCCRPQRGRCLRRGAMPCPPAAARPRGAAVPRSRPAARRPSRCRRACRRGRW
ncbi:hypothetical protein GALL_492520 [mine drainage metagenome]|uniref:Uncharacterized protein n=1 Tax=mine drainage metagenome TaxID=410659 RepID=A0A1J5PNI8_9ZZZZ